MNIKQMRAANAKINPTKVATKANDSTLTQSAAMVIGAAPSAVKGFFSNIGVSYRYHENLRKGQL